MPPSEHDDLPPANGAHAISSVRYYPEATISPAVPIMSSWSRILNLPEQLLLRVLGLYEGRIPISVRKTLTHWIDRQNWLELDPERPELRNTMRFVFDELCALNEERFRNSAGIADLERLSGAFAQLREYYAPDPTLLIAVLRECVLEEQQILKSFDYSMPRPIDMFPEERVLEFQQDYNFLSSDSLVLRRRLQQLSRFHMELLRLGDKSVEQERLLQEYILTNEPEEVVQKIRLELETSRSKISKRTEDIETAFQNFFECFHSRVDRLAKLLIRFVNKHFWEFERSRQAVANGHLAVDSLSTVQHCFECLVSLIQTHLQSLLQLGSLVRQTPNMSVFLLEFKLPLLLERLREMYIRLLHASFFVEEQPEQVVLSGESLTCKIRYLLGNRLLPGIRPEVRATLISEGNFTAFIHSEDPDSNPENNSSSTNLETISGETAARFQLRIGIVDRTSGKLRPTPVIGGKCRLYFEASFSAAGLRVQLCSRSLNFVVIPDISRQRAARASVFWDNLHPDTTRKSFEVQDKMKWGIVSHSLFTKFYAETGIHLSDRHLQCLASEAFRRPCSTEIGGEELLTWSEFGEDPLPGRDFTFWEWFHANMELTRDHLSPFGLSGALLGFIDLERAECFLRDEQNGSFLLRFSESHLGAVSIVSVELDQSRKRVFRNQTFSTQDLEHRTLADRLSELKNILYCYPDTPKHMLIRDLCPLSGNMNV